MTLFEISVLNILGLIALLLIYCSIRNPKLKIEPNQDAARALESIRILLKDLNQKVESLSKQEKPEIYKIEKLLTNISKQFDYGESYTLKTSLSDELDRIWRSVDTAANTLRNIELNMDTGVNIRKSSNTDIF